MAIKGVTINGVEIQAKDMQRLVDILSAYSKQEVQQIGLMLAEIAREKGMCITCVEEFQTVTCQRPSQHGPLERYGAIGELINRGN